MLGTLNIFTFGCCILLRIYPTGSLWCRQSQQSFNTSTPPFFIFPSHSLYVSAPTGHPQVRYTIRCFQGLFLLQRIRCTYTTWRMPISVLRLVVPNTCYQTQYKSCKNINIHCETGLIYKI
jgi:hypothetical protein